MTKEAKRRMNKLADKFRAGVLLSASEDAELAQLEAEFQSGAPAPIKMRSHWDSPVAKACFEADQKGS